MPTTGQRLPSSQVQEVRHRYRGGAICRSQVLCVLFSCSSLDLSPRTIRLTAISTSLLQDLPPIQPPSGRSQLQQAVAGPSGSRASAFADAAAGSSSSGGGPKGKKRMNNLRGTALLPVREGEDGFMRTSEGRLVVYTGTSFDRTRHSSSPSRCCAPAERMADKAVSLFVFFRWRMHWERAVQCQGRSRGVLGGEVWQESVGTRPWRDADEQSRRAACTFSFESVECCPLDSDFHCPAPTFRPS